MYNVIKVFGGHIQKTKLKCEQMWNWTIQIAAKRTRRDLSHSLLDTDKILDTTLTKGEILRCRACLKRLIIAQLLQKSSTFHCVRKFITVFIRTRHCPLSWASFTPYFLKIHFNIILPSPNLHISHVVFLSPFAVKILYALVSFPMNAKCPAQLTP
jgi:hypothetical protein